MFTRQVIVTFAAIGVPLAVIGAVAWRVLADWDQVELTRLSAVVTILAALIGLPSLVTLVVQQLKQSKAESLLAREVVQGRRLLRAILGTYAQKGTGVLQKMELLRAYAGREIVLWLSFRSVDQRGEDTYSIQGRANGRLEVAGEVPKEVHPKLADLDRGRRLLVSGIIDGFQEAATLIMRLRRFAIEQPEEYRTTADYPHRREEMPDEPDTGQEREPVTTSVAAVSTADEPRDLTHAGAVGQGKTESPTRIDPTALRSLLAELLHASHPDLKYRDTDLAQKAVERIARFGYTDLESFMAALPSVEVLARYATREVLAIVNMALILIDVDKYARLIWPDDRRITPKFRRLLRQDGVDTRKLPESDDESRRARLMDPALRARESEITETGLHAEIKARYSGIKEKAVNSTDGIADVIKEMKRMGLLTPEDLKGVLDADRVSNSETIRQTRFQSMADLLRHTLIIWDHRLYFSVGWGYDWNPMAALKPRLNLLKRDGVNVNDIPNEDPEDV